jgi:hypothetical protein
MGQGILEAATFVLFGRGANHDIFLVSLRPFFRTRRRGVLRQKPSEALSSPFDGAKPPPAAADGEYTLFASAKKPEFPLMSNL